MKSWRLIEFLMQVKQPDKTIKFIGAAATVPMDESEEISTGRLQRQPLYRLAHKRGSVNLILQNQTRNA